MMFRLLFIGDVVGEAGCATVQALVPTLRRELNLDAVVANGENSAPSGRGITSNSGSALLSVVDFLTLGNHAFDAEGAEEHLSQELRVIRPANLDENLPGHELNPLIKRQRQEEMFANHLGHRAMSCV